MRCRSRPSRIRRSQRPLTRPSYGGEARPVGLAVEAEAVPDCRWRVAALGRRDEQRVEDVSAHEAEERRARNVTKTWHRPVVEPGDSVVLLAERELRERSRARGL